MNEGKFDNTCAGLLPNDVVFAILLAELDTSPSMPRSFFGERILTRVTQKSSDWKWQGQLLGKSQFCPSTLLPGSEVAGVMIDEHIVLGTHRRDSAEVPIQVEDVPENSCFAIMVSPRDNPSILMSANPFCPNPTCMNVSSITFTKFEEIVTRDAIPSSDPDVEPNLIWECNLCHTTMMIDAETFTNLYKL